MSQDLINPDLFGNEAGEDEELEVLNSYFLEKAEFRPFFDEGTKLAFVRSRKGMGKSALLRQVLFRRVEVDAGELLIYVKASDLIALQEIDTATSDALIHGWQQRICSRINLELGATLRVAGSDDSMTLVESSEIAGFRGRNIVSALVDRFRLKVKAPGVEISKERLAMGDSQKLLARFIEQKEIQVWILIDDVDATFLNNEEERLRTSTFFSACRNLASSVAGLNIRASVRTDVWSILEKHDEALDKCRQYMLDLKWSTEDTGKILSNKLAAFYKRTYGKLPDVKPITSAVFQEPLPWGRVHLQAFRPIHILSAARPRWATQLCRLAGKNAYTLSRKRIATSDIRSSLKEYGQYRLSDLYKEHRHQCNELEQIIEAFAGGSPKYTTAELLQRIRMKVIGASGAPKIDGITHKNEEVGVAHFLFRVGFINARDDNKSTGDSLHFIRFEDRPDLLTSEHNLDDGLPWEVHPSYRSVLRITGGVPEAEKQVPKAKRWAQPKRRHWAKSPTGTGTPKPLVKKREAIDLRRPAGPPPTKLDGERS